MKVFLAVPPTGKLIREDRCQTPIKDLKTVALRPPIELLYAAAGFERAGAVCRIEDYPARDLGWAAYERDLRDFAPDLVVISITCPSLKEDLEAAGRAKRVLPGVRVLAKGALFESTDLRPISECAALDGVLRGECEHTCREIAEGAPWDAIQSLTWRNGRGMVHNPDRPFEPNLDALPFPARHLIDNGLYRRPDTGEMQTTLVTNRGCPHTCIYCLAQQVAGAKHRRRTPANILAEIDECLAMGIKSFLFRSDLFTANKKWVMELCQAICDRRLEKTIDWACNSRVDTIDGEMAAAMKRAGCFMVAFGVESGDDEVLRKLDKKATAEEARRAVALTKAAGIKVSAYFLLGLPWDTRETIEDTIGFACELDPDVAEFFYVYPFPGTELHRQAVEAGLLAPGEVPVEAYGQPAIPSMTLSREDLARERLRALRRYYLRPRYIARSLGGAATRPRVLFNYVRFGVAQLGAMMRPLRRSS
ncbi:MAG: radical SAM protein [Candidatus Sumerlaeia bacterium]|nr:radical SAM protein [Candidatus Sumerlaeia bacterium]